MDYIAFLVAAAATEKASYTAFVPGGVDSMIRAMIMVSPLLTAEGVESGNGRALR